MVPVFLVIAGMALVGLGLWVAQAYRTLSCAREQVEEAWELLKEALAARREMVPYIVAAVQVHAGQVMDVLGNACDLATNVAGVRDCSQAENRLTAAIARVFALVDEEQAEAANESVNKLRESLAGHDMKIEFCKGQFNRQVEMFNGLLGHGGARLLASIGLFKPADAF